MFCRSTLKGVARVALAALLFAQAALALAGCDWLRAAPALAISASSSQPPCHEAPAVNANLCLAHCLSSDSIISLAARHCGQSGRLHVVVNFGSGLHLGVGIFREKERREPAV